MSPTSSEIFKSKWLRAADLKAPILRTIDHVEMRPIGRGDDLKMKPVAFFVEAGSLPFILNAGNWKSIVAISGHEDSDSWAGTRIVLYPTQVEYAGSAVTGVRIRAPKTSIAEPAKAAPRPAPVTAPADDDIPF